MTSGDKLNDVGNNHASRANLSEQFRSLSRIGSKFTLLLSLFFLIALAMNKDDLTRLAVNGPPMTWSLSLALFFSALAFWIYLNAKTVKWRYLASLLSLIPIFIVIAAFLESPQHLPFQLDPTSLNAEITFLTAVLLIFFNIGLIASCNEHRKLRKIWIDQFLFIIILVFTLIALSGYVFNAPQLTLLLTPSWSSGMRFGTAITLSILSLSGLLANTHHGITALLASPHAGGYIARRLALAIFITPPIIGLLVHFGELLGYFPSTYRQAFTAIGICTIFIILTWITAQKLETAELLRISSVQQLQNISERIPDILFSYRIYPDKQFEYLSPAIYSVLGIPAQALYEDPQFLNKIIFPKDATLLAESFQQPEKYQKPFVLRWIRQDGNLVWTENRHLPVYNQQGFLIRIEGISRDITLQKIAEEEREDLSRKVENERRWLHRLIEVAPVAIVSISLHPRLAIRLNQRARELLGEHCAWSLGEWKPLECILGSDEQTISAEREATHRALHGEIVLSEEILILNPHGKLIPALVNATPIQDQLGKILGAISMFEDISSIKELQRAREEWTSIIAHDLRQPITAIEMQSQLLLRNPENVAHVQRLASHIEKSAKQLSRMTSDLLDVSRLESKRLALDLHPTNISQLVREVIERSGFDFQGRQLYLELDENIPLALVDPGRLEQVILNLLSNAIKYSYPKSKISFTVRYSHQNIELFVRNQGKGIDSSDLKLLFQRYYRTQSGKTTGSKGIGLGLYITKGLVEAHGGTIEAQSELDKTTSFRVKLPLRKVSAAA